MPYFYLYDSYLQDRSYAAYLIKLETILTDLGIQGKVGRLTLLKSVKDLVDAAVRDGADTIVAVGNDITLSQVTQVVIKIPNITMGFIPLGNSHQTIAPILGIPIWLLACHVLSGRLVEDLAVGKINNQYWLQSVIIEGMPILECERSFEILLNKPHTVRICNLGESDTGTNYIIKSDHHLVVLLTPVKNSGFSLFKNKLTKTSVLRLCEIKLSSTTEELPLLVDNYRTLKTPATIGLAQQKIRIIVGKKRLI